ncbi:MAG: hypothetical protein CVV42_06170 [Candidatus Riflebacteria bacterium HGW-Riflebacteria-2]|nr:MAG: hypothetical protein CVV42_06170 [Candidatus Riflebacteria bacterium HGW-Riflebacteria-2]
MSLAFFFVVDLGAPFRGRRAGSAGELPFAWIAAAQPAGGDQGWLPIFLPASDSGCDLLVLFGRTSLVVLQCAIMYTKGGKLICLKQQR